MEIKQIFILYIYIKRFKEKKYNGIKYKNGLNSISFNNMKMFLVGICIYVLLKKS